jgi:toxin ParE1/3/4
VRLVFAEPAARDLDDIIDYIAFDDPRAAEKVYRAVVTAATRLGDFPNIGHAGRVPGTRELSVTSLPYIIVYEVGGEAITVLAIFHAARDLARAMEARRGSD